MTPHTFRHTYASMLYEDGRDYFEVARLMGHSDPTFTMRTYGHLRKSSAAIKPAPVGQFMAAA